jgi:hypothetical protein
MFPPAVNLLSGSKPRSQAQTLVYYIPTRNNAAQHYAAARQIAVEYKSIAKSKF